MKTIFSLLLALSIGSALGQFIPQPMGYNPDVNGDEFIGVDDVMGTLALYNNTFDLGDSLVISSLNFPADYPETYGGSGSPLIQIDEATDFLYMHQTEDQAVEFQLPQGQGFKVIQVFMSSEVWNFGVRFFLDESNSDSFGGFLNVQPPRPMSMTFIRGHNGIWYQPGRD